MRFILLEHFSLYDIHIFKDSYFILIFPKAYKLSVLMKTETSDTELSTLYDNSTVGK
jgi:hypothetical protein